MPTYSNPQKSQEKKSKQTKLDSIPVKLAIRYSQAIEIKKTSKLENIPEDKSLELEMPEMIIKKPKDDRYKAHKKAWRKQKAKEKKFKNKIEEKNAQDFVTPKNKKTTFKEIKQNKKTIMMNTKKPKGKYSAGIA